ncbi:MAG: ABC transporter ATP-binding protein [Actinomycetota bacterium]|nr:ABC transporter ATP-binding protein [Actinomycetota bacterium]
MLSVQGLVKSFSGEKRAVDGVSIEVAAGEVFTLLGPSGCGKTTTLRCIAGLERPDEGEIALAGRVVFSTAKGVSVPAHERGLGVVFQSYAIWPHMSVYENVAFPLSAAPRRRRPSRAAIRERVERLLDSVRLLALADRPATDLSGGEQQRLALARALVIEPPLLLLDEPLSSLDFGLRRELRGELQRIQAELGVAFLYVTHDQEEALAVSTRIAVMRAGRVEQVGEPREVYERPRSRYVADFIGAANLLDGLVVDGGVRTSAGVIPVAVELPAGAAVTVVARGEQLEVAVAHGEANGWRGTIRARSFLGDAVEYAVDVSGLELRVRAASARPLEPGAQVDVRFPEAPLVLPR